MRFIKPLLTAIVVAVTSVPAYAYDMTYQNMLVATMKLSPDYDYENNVDGYMQVFRPEVWQQAHDDEFQLHDKEASTLQMMKSAAAAFNLDDPIVIRTQVQFGEYNFTTHAFAFNPFSDSSYFPVNYCCNAILPNQIELYLSNPDLISGLPMSESIAENFLDEHKQYGNVNRNLYIEMDVKLTGLKGTNQLIGKITKFTLYDPMNKNAIVETVSAKSTS